MHIATGIFSHKDVYRFLKAQELNRLSGRQYLKVSSDLTDSKKEALETENMTSQDPIFLSLENFSSLRFMKATYHSLPSNLKQTFLDVRNYVFKIDPNQITKGLAYLHAAVAQITDVKERERFYNTVDVSLFLKLYNRENLDDSDELTVTCENEQYIYRNELTVKITIGQFNYYLVDDASKTIQGTGAFGVYDGNRRDIRDFSDGSFKVIVWQCNV